MNFQEFLKLRRHNMGGRGAFVDVNNSDFTFKENGKNYHSIGEIDGIKVLVQDKGNVKAPEYSHTANRIYAIVQNGALKHLTFYDSNHNQEVSIDLLHKHNKICPHKHFHLNHSDKGIPITSEEQALIDKIKRRFGLK